MFQQFFFASLFQAATSYTHKSISSSGRDKRDWALSGDFLLSQLIPPRILENPLEILG